MRNCDIKIIRYTLEDNGFRELPSQKEVQGRDSSAPVFKSGAVGLDQLRKMATVVWYTSSIKT